VCGFFVGDCIPQPGTAQRLDDLSVWPMVRLQYRNFGSHEAMVSNFTVDLDGTDKAAIRWFELRKSGGPWSLYQEGTHAPDSDHRWMGSIAMDQDGNIALGYSVSSSTTNPAIRYATRNAGDPLGTLQAEASLIEGGGVNLGPTDRWGDYSAMNVDPVDQCTFWVTNEYHDVDESSYNWNTRIGAFEIPGCGGPPPPGCHDILFDETHGFWPGYTIDAAYSDLAAYLEGYGHTVDALQAGPFDYPTINQYDVLVLALPDTPYTIAEKNAILQFVEEGGRLVTIGENGHADFDNARAILNDIHAHLGDGLVHNKDYIYDPTDNGGNPIWPIIHVFSPEPVNDAVGSVVEYAASSLAVSGPAFGTAFGDDDTYTTPTLGPETPNGAPELGSSDPTFAPGGFADSSPQVPRERKPGVADPNDIPYIGSPGPAAPSGEADVADLSDIPHKVSPDLAAPGDIIENFPNTWDMSTIGLLYDVIGGGVRYAHESQPNPTIYDVDYSVPHPVLGSISLSAINPTWPVTLDDRDGAGHDTTIDTVFMPDYNGDLVNADDNIIETSWGGAILNAWETDGVGNDSYDGSFINTIIDIAVVPGAPARYFVAAIGDGSMMYEIDLIKAGWWVPSTWGTLNTCTVPGLIDNAGIDYDQQNGVLYHSDWGSTNIVVTDLNCNLLETFTCESPAGFNTGVTFVEGSSPPEIWVTEHSSNSTTRCEAFVPEPEPVIAQAMTNVGMGDVYAIGDVNMWDNSVFNNHNNSQLAWNVFAFGQVCESGDINGYIDLQGRGDDSGAEVNAWDGSVLVYTTTTTTDGYYELPLDAGMYDITVEMESYLDTEQAGVSVSAGGTTTLNTVTLPGGDTNDDDIVNIQDLALVGAHYHCILGDPCYDPSADINNDDIINIQDLAITGGNYLEVSPVPWP